jgi:transcriptional regulator with XRE-family HTH domain
MEVKPVPTMGWTRRSAAATILLVTAEQKRAIAERVARRMEAQGLTNEQLAYKAGVSVKTVSRILNARHEPRGATIEKVAGAIGYTESELRGAPPPPLGLGAPDPDEVPAQLAAIEKRLAAIEDQLGQLLGAASIDDESGGDLFDRIVKTVEWALNQPASEVAQPPQRRGSGRARSRRQDAA